MKRIILHLIVTVPLLWACNKEIAEEERISPLADKSSQVVIIQDKLSVSTERILVDASKDGGVWWFPQGPNGYDIKAPHQGKKLADYIRSLGFAVDEISIGAKVITDVLTKYKRVIRAGAITGYTNTEIDAYNAFLELGGSLLLAQDHLGNHSNDLLSKQLGVEFAGAGGGTITGLAQHPVNSGVSSIPYLVGSAVVNKDKSNMTILGNLGANDYIDMNRNKIKDAGDVTSAPVMGILHHPKSKIFFIGDVNSIEQVPQPFTHNLIKWLFD